MGLIDMIIWKSPDDTYLIRKERWGQPVWEETDDIKLAILNNAGILIPRHQAVGFKPIKIKIDISIYFEEDDYHGPVLSD